MKKLLTIILLFLLFSASAFKPKRHTTIITITFKETDSYLVRDDTIYFPNLIGSDRRSKITVNLRNEFQGQLHHYKSVLIRENLGENNDTIPVSKILCDATLKVNLTTGNFNLYCASPNPLYKIFSMPVFLTSLDSRVRNINVHLGNPPVIYNYEITSEEKLTRKQKKAIKARLSKYFEDEPDYTDFMDCNKPENERYYRVKPECSFWLPKKCSIRRMRN